MAQPPRPPSEPDGPAAAVPSPPPGPPALPGTGRLLTEMLRRGIDGTGPWHSARQVAGEHLADARGDVDRAVRALITTHVRLAASSGLLTSLGGVATMLVTAPAGVTGLYLVSTRLVAAIAHVRGHDLDAPAVRSAVLITLLGPDGRDLCARTGIDLDAVSLLAGLRRLPDEVREQLDRRVAHRLTGRFGRRGALNLTKLLPLVGGPVGAGADGLAVRTLGTYADVAFPEVRGPR